MSTRLRGSGSAAGIGTVLALCVTPLFAQPDLVVDQPRLANSWFVEDAGFTSSSCALVEECIGGPGVRRLLRFDTLTGNIAQTDLILGNPATDPRFIWSPCHGHYHFSGFSEYQLLDTLGQPVAPGRKQAFCVADSNPYVSAPWVPPSPHFGCNNQGLQRGWSDIYSYAGGICQIGTSGGALVDLPDPAPGYVVWFLIVGVDPFSTPVREGGHGFDSDDRERPLSGVGICPVARTQSGPVCGAAPAAP